MGGQGESLHLQRGYQESYQKNVKIWQDRNKDIDIENGLEDTERGKGKLGRGERVAWTYIHYQM